MMDAIRVVVIFVALSFSLTYLAIVKHFRISKVDSKNVRWIYCMEEVAELTEIEDLESEEFYGFIRRHLICVLFFMFLYTLSYLTIKQLKIRPDYDDLYAGDEDYFVYRISTWICSKSLSISIGAVTLLPFSIVGAEVLQRYPENYYLKWLNFSLINTLWKYVFLLSNLSLFVLLPFSYFFIESQGFSMNIRLQTLSGSIRRPLLARFYETLTICALVIVVLIGIADVFYSHLLSYPSYIWLSLLCFSSLTMPLLYSFASLIGVFLLLLSVPVGFAKIFDKFSHFPDIFTTHHQRSPSSDHHHTKKNGMSSMAMLTPESLQEMANRRQRDKQSRRSNNSFVYRPLHFQMSNANGDVKAKTQQHRPRRRSCSSIPRSSSRHRRMMGGWMRQNLGPFLGKCNQILDFLMFPVIMVAFFLLTALCILMVMSNSLQLLFGFRNLPAYVHYVEEYRHTLGIFGALMEVTIIMYIMTSALVGIYSIPLVRRIKPHRHGTSQTSLIVNCMMISLMCSALPVLVKTLGITTFDLLGDYGRINWISNLSLVLSYNILFAAVSIYCIVYKFSEPVRRELLRRFFTVTNKIPEFRYMNGAISTMNQHDLKKRN